jgi:hypothetical protein
MHEKFEEVKVWKERPAFPDFDSPFSDAAVGGSIPSNGGPS